jgi:glycosyltransferase involved in cell wall biosynthesis
LVPGVLLELFNLTVSQGTGIATYARGLVDVAGRLGYRAGGLLHAPRALSSKDPLLAEVGFFDARNRGPDLLTRFVKIPLHFGMGSPFGIKGVKLSPGAVMASQQIGRALGGLDSLFVAPLFADLARLHFQRWGQCATLRIPEKFDVFHATQTVPIRLPGARNLYTIHDIVPLRLPDSTLDDKKYFLEMVRALGRTADRIVTVSENSRDDLIRICGLAPEKVVNTYQAVDFPAGAIAGSAEEAGRLVKGAFGLDPGQYFLFYGALEPKKNLGRLLDAYLASGSRRKLVIAGGLGWQYDNDLAKIAASKTGAFRFGEGRAAPDERVVHLRYLPLFQLTALIRSARAVVFPSLYEGFGLPVVESMLLGTPVITSNGSSLKEVAGDAALLVDPYDVRSLVAAIQRIDEDDSLCQRLAAGGPARAELFSPERYRERMGRLYEDVLAAPPASRGRWPQGVTFLPVRG